MRVRAEMMMVAWRAMHAMHSPYELNVATHDFLLAYEGAAWEAIREFWETVVSERSKPDEARELGLSILKEVNSAAAGGDR